MNSEGLISRLMIGNSMFLETNKFIGDISLDKRKELKNGQNPYAIILTCSDSRITPEAIFSAGLGDLFVIRVAGNIVGPSEIASIEYAANVLGTKLLMVMGHTHCGAVNSAINGESCGHLAYVLDEIKEGIDDETDDKKASFKNVEHSINKLREKLYLTDRLEIVGGVYDIETGKVDFSI